MTFGRIDSPKKLIMYVRIAKLNRETTPRKYPVKFSKKENLGKDFKLLYSFPS